MVSGSWRSRNLRYILRLGEGRGLEKREIVREKRNKTEEKMGFRKGVREREAVPSEKGPPYVLLHITSTRMSLHNKGHFHTKGVFY